MDLGWMWRYGNGVRVSTFGVHAVWSASASMQLKRAPKDKFYPSTRALERDSRLCKLVLGNGWGKREMGRLRGLSEWAHRSHLPTPLMHCIPSANVSLVRHTIYPTGAPGRMAFVQRLPARTPVRNSFFWGVCSGVYEAHSVYITDRCRENESTLKRPKDPSRASFLSPPPPRACVFSFCFWRCRLHSARMKETPSVNQTLGTVLTLPRLQGVWCPGLIIILGANREGFRSSFWVLSYGISGLWLFENFGKKWLIRSIRRTKRTDCFDN